MIPETIEYLNPVTGQVVQKEWYFSLDKAELAEMKIRHEGPNTGTLEDYLDAIVKEQDNNKLLDHFKVILYKSVGVRERDHIVKNQDLLNEFVGSGAYEAMFMKMLGDAEYAAHLINGIIPADMAEKVQRQNLVGEAKEYTDAQLLAMSEEEFFEAAGSSNPMKWPPRFLLVAHQRKSAA